MARIILSGVFDSITGSLGGSVIQYSYGGLQLRTKVKSKNPQSGYQQAVRNRFAQISYRWKALDTSFKTSWIDATGQPTTGNQLFQSCNINAILVGWEGIAEWTDIPAPGEMTFTIEAADTSHLIVAAYGSITTVPTDTRLLIEISKLQPGSRYFQSEDSFAPVIWYDEGEDMSVNHDIITAYNNRFGTLEDGKTLTVRFVLISTVNGLRGTQVRQQVITPVV